MAQYTITLKVVTEDDQVRVTDLFTKLTDRLVESGKLVYVDTLTIEKRNRGGRPATSSSKVQEWVRKKPAGSRFSLGDITHELGVHRTVVWKQLEKLIQLKRVEKRSSPWDNVNFYTKL